MIERMCKHLKVSNSAYYRRFIDPVGQRERANLALDETIKEADFQFRGKNGSLWMLELVYKNN